MSLKTSISGIFAKDTPVMIMESASALSGRVGELLAKVKYVYILS